MRIGIDVGGTNTDAVLMDGMRVLAEVKTGTTADVTSGIVAALQGLVEQSGASASDVQAVMIGTTHFTNAVVEAKRLVPTAVVRLGLPATRALPPLVAWPPRLRKAIAAHVYLCHGGHEFDGREISPLDRDELLRVAEDIRGRTIRSIAISSVFSPVNASLEEEAAAILGEELPGLPISLSHEIGRIGLLERENATVMNACLRELAEHDRCRISLRTRGTWHRGAGVPEPERRHADERRLRRDLSGRHFASGPTNSMRGAALLSGLEDCAVVDIGGTTSDVGVLQHGFPREASVSVDIGGVRTNFRMPDVLSLGLGGGSRVRGEEPTIGPDSVGYELPSRALVFGGETLTASDLAVAGGRASFGDPAAVAGLDAGLVQRGLAEAERMLAETVDRMKTSPDPIPVVVVGGGSVLLGDSLPGASRLIRPDHFAVANAIGAAIAQVGGEVERVFSLDQLTRDAALDQAKSEAVDKAVAAGATASSVRIVDVEDVPLPYIPGNATRIKVKAVGDLELERFDGA